MAIPNRNKETLDNLIDSSDTKSPYWPRLIDKGLRNTLRSKGSPTRLLKKDRLDKDISDRLSWVIPKIRDSQMYQCYDIVRFGLKSGRSQYGKV